MRYTSALLAFLFLGHLACAQEMPFPRRLLILTQAFLDSAERRDPPPAIPGDKSRVLVLFRVAEGGSVIDTHATGGSESARAAAAATVSAWRFGPTLVAGQPVQMQSGVLFDFSSSPPRVEAPSPMSAGQISPVLSNRCYFAISKGDPEPVTTCGKEARFVDMNRSHTVAESVAAHDELGVALLRYSRDPGKALAEFNRSIELASEGLTTGDGEMGQLYWHRAAAERELNQAGQASADFALAAKSFDRAAQSGHAKAAGWYRACLTNVVKEHASMLDRSGKHDEAARLLETLGQEQ